MASAGAISNTSPLLYLYRIGRLEFLATLFGSVWAPTAVLSELEAGAAGGHDVPSPSNYSWIQIVDPANAPADNIQMQLGRGESAAIALATEHPERVILLDDALARQTAHDMGLIVWGTLRVLLEAKNTGLLASIAPSVDALRDSGMWIGEDVKLRILRLAGEA